MKKLITIEGIGPKVAADLQAFFSSALQQTLIQKLLQHVKVLPLKQLSNASAFSGKTLVFTGKLSQMGRGEAKNKAETLDAKVGSVISAHTDYLIVGENAGSKLKKANLYGNNLSERGRLARKN